MSKRARANGAVVGRRYGPHVGPYREGAPVLNDPGPAPACRCPASRGRGSKTGGRYWLLLAAFALLPVGSIPGASQGSPAFGAGPWRSEQVLGIAFSADGKRLAAEARGTPFFVWDASTGREVDTVSRGDSRPVGWSLALSPRGNRVAAVAGTGPTTTVLRQLALVPWGLVTYHDAAVWDVAPGMPTRKLYSPEALGPHASAGLAFSPDGKFLAADEVSPSSPRLRLKVWDLPNDRLARGFSGFRRHAIRAGPPAFSPQGYLAAQPQASLTLVKPAPPVSLWDVTTGKVIQTYKGCGPVLFLTFSVDGKALAGARGSKICAWTADTRAKYQPTTAQKGPVAALVFSDDNTLEFAVIHSGTYVWRLKTQSTALQCAVHGLVLPAQFSADGKFLAWADPKAPIVHLWDVQACKEIRSFSMERTTKKAGRSAKQ